MQSTDVLRLLCRPLTARDYGASAGSSAAASGRSAPSSAAKGRVLTAAQGNVLCRVCLSRTPWLPGHKNRKVVLHFEPSILNLKVGLFFGIWVLAKVNDPARHVSSSYTQAACRWRGLRPQSITAAAGGGGLGRQ